MTVPVNLGCLTHICRTSLNCTFLPWCNAVSVVYHSFCSTSIVRGFGSGILTFSGEFFVIIFVFTQYFIGIVSHDFTKCFITLMKIS